jgi:hypothetical protein
MLAGSYHTDQGFIYEASNAIPGSVGKFELAASLLEIGAIKR